MKYFLFAFLFSSFSLTSFSQDGLQDYSVTKNKSFTVMVKLKNQSFKSYELTIPNVVSTSSVRIGTSSFCMAPGQEIYFTYEGKQYLLLQAQPDKKVQKFNLSRLVKKRKKEYGLK